MNSKGISDYSSFGGRNSWVNIIYTVIIEDIKTHESFMVHA
jgi:hypothetical protein